MDWKKLLRSITASVDEELQLRNAYLAAENRLLRKQIPGRVQLADNDRRALAELGHKLGKKALAEIATATKVDTILAWHRRLVDQRVDSSGPRKPIGRPRVTQEIEALVVRMARENRSWGYDRIVGALATLGYTISDQTVGNILKRHGIPPAPTRKKTVTWQEFVRIHLALLLAADFFNGAVWSWFGLMISSLLRLVHFVHRRTHSVVIGLQHHMQRLSSLVIWMPAVKERLQLQELQFGEVMLEPAVSELLPCGAGQPQSQDRGKVVVLSNVHPGPIRDGPMRSRQQLGNLFRGVEREAA